MKRKIDSLDFRHVMGCFATGVAVVTARDGALGTVGLTINSLTSVSLEPPLVLFCLDRAAHLHKALRRAEHFAVNFLAAGQENVSRHFASRHHAEPKNMWAKPSKDAGHEVPLLRGTLGWVLCRSHAFHKGGDHTIIVGEVVDLHRQAGSAEPLLYFRGRYRDLAAGKVTSGARK